MTIIIAEAGVNHNGDLDTALRLVDAAVIAGANVVKFQTFKAKSLVTAKAERANYQKQTTKSNESQFSMLKTLELSEEMHIKIIDYCRSKKIKFLSTPFDEESVKMLARVGQNNWKIPSGEITNLPYLRLIGSLEQEIILSTGMANIDEIKQALSVIEQSGTTKDKITVLHCNTAYPTPMSDVNLNAMVKIKNDLGVKVGYSDHTRGISIPIAATALGATIIEKHLTLNTDMIGPDHKASLEPCEFAAMVKAIREVEVSMGDGIKQPTKSEKDNILCARKSIVASAPIRRGEVFTQDNICAKRPGTGISPMRWDEVIGKISTRSYHIDDLIEW